MNRLQELAGRIIVDPDIMVGKPIIKGTRLTVELILGLLMQGMTINEIIDDYPNLTPDDIYACLAFAKKTLENTTFMPLQL